MSGLRVDTFKIFNSRRDHRPDREAPFKHIRAPGASPEMDDGVEALSFQWVSLSPVTTGPLPTARRAGYPRLRFSSQLFSTQPLNLKQVGLHGGH